MIVYFCLVVLLIVFLTLVIVLLTTKNDVEIDKLDEIFDESFQNECVEKLKKGLKKEKITLTQEECEALIKNAIEEFKNNFKNDNLL